MKDNIKKPCKECPFKKTSARGWLGGLTAQETHDFVLREANFACHMTRHKPDEQMSRCKGSQLFIINHCKLPRINMPLAAAVEKTKAQVKKGDLKVKDYLGFDFIKHHTI